MNLDELYFKDNFTKEEDKINLSINRLEAECITSKNNKFSLDENGNLTVNSINTNNNSNNDLYPIGSIYMSVNNTNPSTLFGGTWEQIKDTFLLACGNKYNNGDRGGEEKVKLDLPNYQYRVWNTDPENKEYNDLSGSWQPTGNFYGYGSVYTSNKNIPHNNMPPYLAIYIWKRVG